MCRCGASFGSAFLFENGASVDGASVEFHREGGNFRKSESGDRGGETENGKGRKLREKRRGKREEEGEEITECLGKLGKVFFDVITRNPSEVIRTSVELSRSIGPKDRWKSKGEHVLGFFKKLL